MSDLQEIWNNIPESSLSEKEIGDAVNRKAVHETDRLKRVLKMENLVSALLMVLLGLLRDQFEVEIIVLCGGIAVAGLTLNFFTLRKLNQIRMFQGGRNFLVQCIRALKYFVTAFLLTVQLAGLFIMGIVKAMKAKNMDWVQWLASSDGLFIILLLVLINALLLSYAWVFYIQRIRTLTRFLKEMDSEY